MSDRNSAYEEILGLWKEPVHRDTRGFYIHPADKLYLESWFQNRPHLVIKKFRADPKLNHALHLGVPPVPFVGNLKNPRIVLAMINPTVTEQDETDADEPSYKSALESCLHQSSTKCFALAQTDFAPSWTCYYRGIFKRTVLQVSSNGMSEQAVWGWLENNVLIAELYPYFSRFAPLGLDASRLPTSIAMRNWVRATAEETTADKVAILCRWKNGPTRWGVSTERTEDWNCRKGTSPELRNRLALLIGDALR